MLAPALYQLLATVSDDGIPYGYLSMQWSMVNGPAGGEANIDPSKSESARAAFTKPGLYVLRMSANDGVATYFDDTSIRVNP